MLLFKHPLAIWLISAFLGIFSYLYGMDGMHIPSTGDEGPYLQITRLTAQTGHLLPLQSVEGLGVTKPPLLFWQGIFSTDWGNHWELWRLRLPVIILTFLTSLTVFFATRRITAQTEPAAIAALAFLAFTSIFHHGRPFITNLLEIFFLSSTFFAFLLYSKWHDHYRFWLILGLLVGMSAWSRSIFLLAPVGLAFSILLLWQSQWKIPAFLKIAAPRLAIFGLTTLATFGLWLVIDPNPAAIIHEFLLGENVAKLKSDGYWSNFFSGPYPVWSVWFGIYRNSGFLAIPLLFVTYLCLRNREQLTREEKSIWIWIAAFVLFFTIPAQRQDSYILSVMPATAVLLGIYWRQIPPMVLRLAFVPIMLIFLLLIWLIYSLGTLALPPGAYTTWNFLAPILGVILVLAGILLRNWAGKLILPSIFMTFTTFACMTAPLDGKLGQFNEASMISTMGKIVHVPSNFRAQYERYRFLLPGAEILSYETGDTSRLEELLTQGEWVIAETTLHESAPVHCNASASRISVRSRVPPDEAATILKTGNPQGLLSREWLCSGKA